MTLVFMVWCNFQQKNVQQKNEEKALPKINFHRFIMRVICDFHILNTILHGIIVRTVIEFPLSVSLPPITLSVFNFSCRLLALWLLWKRNYFLLFSLVLFIYTLFQNVNVLMHTPLT
ncbi:hypothetical protein VNO77_09823 [Canavalia gladiata]|uniref:Uncharacterized protein n=1 Tax=Canavalia gladiata TaxID=3824 RepID=A0AAN9MAA8_CANGL